MNEVNILWSYLLANGIATENEMQLVTAINGYSVESLQDILYARTGYHSIEQIKNYD